MGTPRVEVDQMMCIGSGNCVEEASLALAPLPPPARGHFSGLRARAPARRASRASFPLSIRKPELTMPLSPLTSWSTIHNDHLASHCSRRLRRGRPAVVSESVYRSESFFRPGDHVVYVFRVGDFASESQGFTTVTFYLRLYLLKGL